MSASRSRVLRLFALLLVVSFYTSTNSLRADPLNAPEKLLVKCGSDVFREWWTIELEGQDVIYTKHYRNKPEERFHNKPRLEDWRTFRKTLDELQVWKWQLSNLKPGAIDGEQWSAAITYPDKALNITADNNYPDANGAAVGGLRSTETFRAFVSAVWRLMGKTTENPPPTN
jgi:hypothetical protein